MTSYEIHTLAHMHILKKHTHLGAIQEFWIFKVTLVVDIEPWNCNANKFRLDYSALTFLQFLQTKLLRNSKL